MLEGIIPVGLKRMAAENQRNYQTGGEVELRRSLEKNPVRFRPRINEALNPRKRLERAMLEGRVPATRDNLAYVQGSSLMDRKTDPSPKRSIWDARFGGLGGFVWKWFCPRYTRRRKG